MDDGLPMLHCLLQHTLRSFCCNSSASSKWVYAVFWRIVPRNFPPPKWDYGGTALDRSKNKRNWILVWEDGYCDFSECEPRGNGYVKGGFAVDVFFKMSHEVYSFGEGLVGKVAAENSHKWVFKDAPNNADPASISSWSMCNEPQPRAWEIQFSSGIQTIAIISVKEGIIQLGSFDKNQEDIDLVISIQRKFIYLQSMPGFLTLQRPSLPIQQHPCTLKPNNHILGTQETTFSLQGQPQLTSTTKRVVDDLRPRLDSPSKAINLGWNTPQTSIIGPQFLPIPSLLPSMTCSLGALLSKLPSNNYAIEVPDSPFFSNFTYRSIHRGNVGDNCGVLGEDNAVAAKASDKKAGSIKVSSGSSVS